MFDQDQTKVDIRRFVHGKIPNVSVSDDQDLLALGFVTSLFAMELVMFVEKQFELRVPNDELRLDNFRSVDAITALVEKLTTNTFQSAGSG